MQKIPLLTVKAGPRDGADWVERLKEELAALIKYVQINKASCGVPVDSCGLWYVVVEWDECLVIIMNHVMNHDIS